MDARRGPKLKLARSFDEALDLACKLNKVKLPIDEKRDEVTIDRNTEGVEDGIDCWVAGGESLYKEALKHPFAKEVYLTHVDLTVDVDQYKRKEGIGDNVAYFPLEVMKECGFEAVSLSQNGICTFRVYKRRGTYK